MRSKYGNSRTEVDGVRYDSWAEYLRHLQLENAEECGEISDLRYHSKLDAVTLQEVPRITYKPDFTYIKDGKKVIEDVKGFQTDVFKIKKKLVAGQILRGELDAVFLLTKKNSADEFDIIEIFKKEDGEQCKN